MNCGTRSGYQLHLRLKTQPCIDCKAANAQRRREYYASNPKKVYDINRRWAASNPDKVKGYSRRMTAKRKALKMSNGHTPYTDEEVFALYGTDCHICLKPIDFNAPRQAYIADNWELGLHFDHLIPLTKGGPDNLENIRPAHALCNIKKRNK